MHRIGSVAAAAIAVFAVVIVPAYSERVPTIKPSFPESHQRRWESLAHAVRPTCEFNSQTAFRVGSGGAAGGIFPRICGAQAKIVGENRRSHPAEKTQHTWALGTRGADRPFRYPPSPPVIYGAIFDPPLKFRPPPPTPP